MFQCIDLMCELVNYGLSDVVEDLVIRYIDATTILKMCQVSKSWRCILNNSYIWRKISFRYGIVIEKNYTNNNKEQTLPMLCDWGIYFRRRVKRKRNFQNGKYRKRFLPSLYENIFEETESFSSCMDFHNGKIVFGSENGSILLWKPGYNGGMNYSKKFNIGSSKIEKVYINGNLIAVFESGRMLIYDIEDFNTINLLLVLDTGVACLDGLSVSLEADLCVFSVMGSKNLTKCVLSNCAQETFCIHKDFKVNKLKLCTEKDVKNLLLVLVSDELSDTSLLFYDIEKHILISKYSAPEFNGPLVPISITCHENGVFIEGCMTAEEDIKMNMWVFLNFEGGKIGSYIYESKLGTLVSGNKTGIVFGHGSLESSSFSLENNLLILAEGESRKMDSIAKYQVEIFEDAVKLERDWMNTYQNSDYYMTDRGPAIASSSFNEIIIKTSSNKHLLEVMDHSTGGKKYNIPIDMFVDHMAIQDGVVLLINANNMLLSVILDFDI
eukprot:GFUD01003815.1.p1 GENE.GFUD01003815.1~~GFUD01003815.1.p1  ORF type:complete len:496 (+),score=83.31 GFUD01003815.1:28-1515(+)